MKYCAMNRISNSIKKYADEIRIYERDIKKMLDYVKDYPDKDFVISVKDFVDPRDYQSQINGTIKVEVEVFQDKAMEFYKKHNIPFFWKYEAFNYEDVLKLKQYGVCAIVIGEELCFDLPRVRKIVGDDIEIRVNPCINYYPGAVTITSKWFRPQDAEKLSQYIDVFDIEGTSVKHSEVLFKIYAIEKKWINGIKFLVPGMEKEDDVLLDGILDEVIDSRISCKHRCKDGFPCHICEYGIKFTNLVTNKMVDDLYKEIFEEE